MKDVMEDMSEYLRGYLELLEMLGKGNISVDIPLVVVDPCSMSPSMQASGTCGGNQMF
jgi:hypothetical protein